MNRYANYVYYVVSLYGVFGPMVTTTMVIYSVGMTKLDRGGYIILFLWQPANIALNSMLKKITNEDRPNGGRNINNIERLIDTDTKGMPSGHAQMVTSTLVLANAMNSVLWIQTVCLIQYVVTIWQRYHYRKHTCIQLIFGTLVGAVFSLFYSYFLILRTNDLKPID